MAGILDTKTNQIYIRINDPNGRLPARMHKFIKTRVTRMPKEVKEGYVRTKGAGTHAEVLALNDALLERPDAKLTEFVGYVLTTKKIGKKYPNAGMNFARCLHCSFITKGVRFISEEGGN